MSAAIHFPSRPPDPPSEPRPRWNPRSVALIVLAWLVLHIGCLFTPGLLDDVDSVYIEIARQMLVRHNYVTPYIDGIRFFDKPPLMYWLSAGSMAVFGQTDWAGRLPLALLMLALLLATYALGLRLFAGISPAHPDRPALYSALALATCIGPFLYTRFYIPDVVVALWLTLAIHAFLVALERVSATSNQPGAPRLAAETWVSTASKSALLPSMAFAAVTALNLLTKGFIGLVFPLAFVFFYMLLTRQLRLITKFHLISSTLVFLLIAAPWHILAALRNPPIAFPPGTGLPIHNGWVSVPAHAGWAWFYLYNEHIARFLQHRIPQDYGQVPIPIFWLLTAIWIFPWLAFVPGAIRQHCPVILSGAKNPRISHFRDYEAALTLLLWALLILGFFTLSARQEYYALPALPALALMAGGLLAAADKELGAPYLGVPGELVHRGERLGEMWAQRSALFWHRWLLLPIGSLCAAIALFFAITAPHVPRDTDIATLLSQGGEYDLSLGHLFDLTGRAMGLFRGPLIFFGLSMAAIGPLTYWLRRRAHTYAANLALAAAAACLLLCMHAGLVRFYPTLGSKGLAEAILAEQAAHPEPPNQQPDLIVVDGEMTAGSTLLFYTRQPAHLVNARINGPWFGSFWPDAPHIFETDASLRQLWSSPQRIFLLTYHPDQRIPDLTRFGAVRTLASSGGKSILTNHP